MFVLVKRLLLIKMKKIQIAFLTTFALSVLYYLLSSRSRRNIDESALEFEPSITLPNDKVHIFYDAFYRNEKTDKAFLNWYKNGSEKILNTRYYPELDLYSSNNPAVVDLHMKQIRNAGVGVVVVSWWPNDHPNSPPMLLILNRAQKYGLKVTIHVQNYPDRTLTNLMKNIKNVLDTYGNHSAFYLLKVPKQKRPLPLIYIYESLAIKPSSWNQALDPSSKYTIRNTKYDALFIGLIIQETDRYLVANSDFDGYYTMLSLSDHTYASTWYYWPYIQDFARDHNLIFIPTISPGYDYRMSKKNMDPLLIPPLVSRDFGGYYDRAWFRAIVSKSKFIAINSFNGWLAGTQIEPALPSEDVNEKLKRNYEDYAPGTGEEYLLKTRKWVIEFSNRSLYRSP
ncbi:hypothetical protein ILUMI_07406 [Ignelater luminosus]|uniref:Glycoprotein endo-alpha-1,2-mannosidase n=1 Tax=Ignelater luminosus TaxID=2038154 RepID=A0A8K0D8W3_IGNLU|nr:hypothetical protein ILUMI_07406 [Ignelater luminosus]